MQTQRKQIAWKAKTRTASEKSIKSFEREMIDRNDFLLFSWPLSRIVKFRGKYNSVRDGLLAILNVSISIAQNDRNSTFIAFTVVLLLLLFVCLFLFSSFHPLSFYEDINCEITILFNHCNFVSSIIHIHIFCVEFILRETRWLQLILPPCGYKVWFFLWSSKLVCKFNYKTCFILKHAINLMAPANRYFYFYSIFSFPSLFVSLWLLCHIAVAIKQTTNVKH